MSYTEMTARDQVKFSELRKAFYLGWNVKITWLFPLDFEYRYLGIN